MDNSDTVLAFQPRSIDPAHFVAEDFDELLTKEGDEISGDQCDDCGSFNDSGEPVGYIVRAARGVVECEGCHREIPIVTLLAGQVIF